MPSVSSANNGAAAAAAAAPPPPATTRAGGRRRKEAFGSASTTRSSSSGSGEKKFVCRHDGCERSFTRAEHLQRHLLNHSSGDFTCGRCRAHFKRRDLLGECSLV